MPLAARIRHHEGIRARTHSKTPILLKNMSSFRETLHAPLPVPCEIDIDASVFIAVGFQTPNHPKYKP